MADGTTYSQVDGGADQQAPQQGGFFSRLGAGLKKVMPYVTPIANRLAAAAGNYGPIELEHQQREQELEAQRTQATVALQQSQAQTQELNRQLLQKQIENVRTPEQTAAAQLEQAGKLEQQKNVNAPPTDIVAPSVEPGGGMVHYNRSFNQQSGQWEVKPTTVPRTVPNPTLPQTQPPLPSGSYGPQQPPTEGAAPAPIGGRRLLQPSPTVQQQVPLPAMQKPASAAGDVEPDGNSPTGFSRVWRGPNLAELSRVPAPAPYAYVPQQTTSTVQQTGPTGLHEVNTTQTTRQPVGAGATIPRVPQTRPPVPNAVNMQGPEASKLMDQNTTLDQTNAIINRIRASKAQFASLIDAGLITLAVDPNTSLLSVISSRNLTPEQQEVAGDWQSLAEHINILRQPLGGTGFRSEEAWGALQAQRGKLTQAPGIIDRTLSNTQQILRGLRANNRYLLGPLDNSPAPAAGSGFAAWDKANPPR